MDFADRLDEEAKGNATAGEVAQAMDDAAGAAAKHEPRRHPPEKRARFAAANVRQHADPDADLNYRTSRWNRWMFRDGGHEGSEWVADGEQRPGWRQASREVFSDLYQGGGLKPVDDPPESGEWARKVHGELDETPEYRQLRAVARRDQEWSGLAAERVMRAVMEQLPDPDGLDSPEDLQQAADALDDVGDHEAAGAARSLAEQAQQAAQDDSSAVDEGTSVIRAVAAQAAREATDDIRTAQEAWNALGGEAPGSGEGSPTRAEVGRQKLELARRVADLPDLAEVMRIAGRLQRHANASRMGKIRPHVGEVVDITRGDDVGRLLPSELARLADPDLEMVALRDIVERQALCYEMEGDGDVDSRGAVIVLEDISGSMNAGSPSRHTWAKGVLVAVVSTCRAERRPVAIGHYNAALQRIHFFARNAPPTPGTMLDHLSVGLSGGTNVASALATAEKAIENRDGPDAVDFVGADYVIVTDGQDREPDLDAIHRAGRKVFGVFIDCGAPSWADSLDGYCEITDEQIRLGNDGAAANVALKAGR